MEIKNLGFIVDYPIVVPAGGYPTGTLGTALGSSTIKRFDGTGWVEYVEGIANDTVGTGSKIAKIWSGTSQEYAGIPAPDADIMYFIKYDGYAQADFRGGIKQGTELLIEGGAPPLPILFEVKIKAPTLPAFLADANADIFDVTDLGGGEWLITSTKIVTHVAFATLPRDATEIEIIKGDTLTSFKDSLKNMSSLTKFVWNGACNITDMGSAFYGCTTLNSVIPYGMDLAEVTTAVGAFENANLSGNLPELHLPKVNYGNDMFRENPGVVSYAFSPTSFSIGTTNGVQNMFENNTNLECISILRYRGTGASHAFRGCDKLVYPPKLHEAIREEDRMSRGTFVMKDPSCTKAKKRAYIRFATDTDPAPTNVTGTGSVYTSLSNLHPSADDIWLMWIDEGITHISGIASPEKIKRIWVDHAPSLTSLKDTFKDMVNLTEFNVYSDTTFENVTNMESAWENCSSLPRFQSDMGTSKVTNMTNTWKGCSSLGCMSSLDTTAVTAATGTFAGAVALADPASSSAVRSGDDAVAGAAWTNLGTCARPVPAISMRVMLTSVYVTPVMPTTIEGGGTLSLRHIDNGIWMLETESGVVTNFSGSDVFKNYASVHVYSFSTVTAMKNIFNIGYLKWLTLDNRDTFITVTDWSGAFAHTTIENFPVFETSQVTNFTEAWTAAQSVKCIPEINTNGIAVKSDALPSTVDYPPESDPIRADFNGRNLVPGLHYVKGTAC